MSTAKYVLALPDTIKIGPFSIAINKVEKIGSEDLYYGEFVAHEERISIILNHPSKLRAADTMLHEILHALWNFGHATGEEEQSVGALATGLMQVMADNPDLLAWWRKAYD